MGDGVNIAAPIEGIAKPGAICLSRGRLPVPVVKGRPDLAVTDLGPTQLKNIADPIRVYLLNVGQCPQGRKTPRSPPASAKICPAALSRWSCCRSPISAATGSRSIS